MSNPLEIVFSNLQIAPYSNYPTTESGTKDPVIQIQEGEQDPAQQLAVELMYAVFSFLDLSSLGRSCRVNRSWSVVANDDKLWNAAIRLELHFFGQAEWARYYGDIGKAPDLPVDSRKRLKSAWDEMVAHEKRIAVQEERDLETVRVLPAQKLFTLKVIPSTLDRKPFEAEMFDAYIQAPQGGGHATKYRYFSDEAKAALQQQGAIATPYIALITRTVIKGSRILKYVGKQALVNEMSGFRVLKGIEAITVNFTEYVATGVHLYGQDPLTCTYCLEVIQVVRGAYPLSVGAFSPAGLGVGYNFDYDDDGVAILRKF